ncbi:MAG: rod shape-determining protein RodA [Firmicutes bacterium]|nr:rod shape-determining protein RodA [Bacillota bacterium]
MLTKKQFSAFDFILLILVIALVACGITAIGSATRININGPGGEYRSQMIWFATGMILLLAVSFIDYHTICRFYIPIYIFNTILLVLVLLIGDGDEIGVRRWLFGLQPSEFAKIFMIIFLSKFIDKNQKKVNNIGILLLVCLLTAVPFMLIKKQPSLSASLVLIAILGVELFAGRLSYKYILIVLLVAFSLALIIYVDLLREEHPLLKGALHMEDYQISRLTDYLNKDYSSSTYYQTKHSIWAIGSGQLRGKGLYNGTVNQLSYLPESHNDFVFAVIGEEFGFLGCLAVILIMFCIITKCLIIAAKATDNLGRLIAVGVGGMFAFQTFVNIGVVTGLLPNTGMTFPFLSYGGSSIWTNMLAIGLVLNVGMCKPKSMFEG